MKKRTLIILSFLFAISCSATALEKSPVFDAMKDELKRTTKQLKMKDMQRPYYVAYTVNNCEKLIVEASFGALTSSDYQHNRNLLIDLRVGNYELDNSNFVSQRGSGFSFTLGGKGRIRLPIEDDYDAIRYEIWLATDRAYKDALGILSKKKAALKNRAIKDRPPDFTRVKPTIYVEPEVNFTIDQNKWETCVKDLSNIFRDFPKIQFANLKLKTEVANKYFIDSEGSKHRCNNLITYLEVYAETQSANGAPMKDMIGFYGFTVSDLPPHETMKTRIQKFAKELSDRVELEKSEEYVGPVLFDNSSASQLFYQLIGKGVSNTTPPLYENEMFGKVLAPDEGFLSGKLNRTILPESFNIYDDPTIKDWNGKPLIGGLNVDDQGVKARRIEIVKDGKLENLPMSRTPIKELKKSNGHARAINGGIPVGRVSNLVVDSKEVEKDIRDSFIQLLKDRELDYGILITRLKGAIPKTGAEMATFFSSMFQGKGKKRLLSPPVCAYKLYIDGHLETIRGLEFESITYKMLKDIILTGAEKEVHNFVTRDKFHRELPMCVIAPAVVVDDLELIQSGAKPVKPPVISHPYFKCGIME